jgi:hypothetical protein
MSFSNNNTGLRFYVNTNLFVISCKPVNCGNGLMLFQFEILKSTALTRISMLLLIQYGKKTDLNITVHCLCRLSIASVI